jgi:hypothetical protein
VFFVFDEIVPVVASGVLSFASSGTDYNQLNTMVYETAGGNSLQMLQGYFGQGYYLGLPDANIPFSLISDTFGSGRATMFLNGLQRVTTTNGATFTNSTGLVIGARMGGGTIQNFLNGVIGEVILFNRPLPTNQRQQVEGYLAWKWGLEANLPSTHPFKLFPPSP